MMNAITTVLALIGVFAVWVLLESFSLEAIAIDQCGRLSPTPAAYTECMTQAGY